MALVSSGKFGERIKGVGPNPTREIYVIYSTNACAGVDVSLMVMLILGAGPLVMNNIHHKSRTDANRLQNTI